MSVSTDRANINVPLRGYIALGLILGTLFLIVLRLWYLQILNGEYFRERSENNRIRTVFVPPPRGLILDRQGRPLVKNRPAFNVELIAEDSPDPKATVEELSKVTGHAFEELWARFKNQRKRRRFEPKLILKDVSRDTVARVKARRHQLPGVIINVVPARDYLYGSMAAHALGYIREITAGQLEKPYYSGYLQGDMVGQYGIESKWERDLQGKRGMQSIVVDASGTRIGEAASEKAITGHTLKLTLDIDVQQGAEKAMEGRNGAVVALDATTGEVLAMLSHPAFDPNLFSGEVTAEQWKDLVSGKGKKLNNRAMQGTYPPGSVFKVFMSAAALSEQIFTESSHVNCPGRFHFAGRDYRCHKKTGHGPVDHFLALVKSCDVYYYTAGQRLGVDRIADYAKRFGLGEKTGLDLGEEAVGIIPSTAWKKAYFKDPANQKWFPGETLSVAIGQGAVTQTPLQLAVAVGAMVNGGRILKPYIVERVSSIDGSLNDVVGEVVERRKVDVEPDVIEVIKHAMEGVVNDPQGTGKRASLEKEFGVKVGGKTGTSQVAALEFHRANSHLEDHAWFVGYAPVEKPEIVVAALVENGGSGGKAAAPVVKETMIPYFAKKLPRLDLTPAPSSTPSAAEEENLAD